MGIIKAINSSLSSSMQDQWLDYFYCDSIPSDYLMTRGSRRGNGEGSSGSHEVISAGSIISVADGQAALFIAANGEITCYSEPGEHKITNGEATLFQKGGLKGVLSNAVTRVGFGGDVPPSTQRLYYVNTKEIPGREFSASAPVPFHVKDENTGIDMDCSIEISGVFSYHITDPVTAYKKLMGNVSVSYQSKNIASQMESELLKYIMSVGAGLNVEGARPSQLPLILEKLACGVVEAMNQSLEQNRGISLISVNFSSFSVLSSDAQLIASLQKTHVLMQDGMAAAYLVSAGADALRIAAANAGGIPLISWLCSCGNRATTNFCENCGAKRPENSTEETSAIEDAGSTPEEEPLPEGYWRCSCGTITKDPFCMNCGRRKGAPAQANAATATKEEQHED